MVNLKKVEVMFVCAMSFIRFSFIMATALVLVAGCARYSHENASAAAADLRPHVARLSQAQAINIAKLAAEREGRRLIDYKDPEAHYEFIQKDRSWSIFFDGKVPMFGNHFVVVVDDQTKSTRIMPGR